MRSAATTTLNGRLHCLDALRGLAAVSVMVFHFFAVGVSPVHEQLAAQLPGWIGWVVGHLYCGVEVFFVLSGFVIAFSMDGYRADWRYAGNFILRRSLRLDPPYWVAAFLTVGYFFWLGPWRDYYLMYGGLKGILSNLFYLQNLPFVYPAHGILDVAWTLCLEVQFYLSYLLLLVVAYYSARSWVAALGVAMVSGWSLWHWFYHSSPDFGGRAWTFFLGVAIYWALRRRVPTGWVAAGIVALAAVVIGKGHLDGVVSVATAGAIFAIGIAGRLSTMLAYRPLLHLGKISYSIYLLHMLIGLNLLDRLKSAEAGSAVVLWLSVTAAIILSLAGAEVLHRLVEAPSNRLSQRFKRRQPALATESG